MAGRIDTPDDSSESESLAYGLLRDSIQQIVQEVRNLQQEVRNLQQEVQRQKDQMSQLSQQIAMEQQRRRDADAIRDRQLRNFMVRVSNAVNAFTSQQDDDEP